MSLSKETIHRLEEEYKRLEDRRGTEYCRWYGILTASMEYIYWILEDPDGHEDEDYEFVWDLGPEAQTQAEDWLEDFYWQVLDEVYECQTKEQFHAKFHPNCSLAWLYFWDVKHWDRYTEPLYHLKELNDDRKGDYDYQSLPQWMLDEMASWEG